jgi:hypothetical protein
MVTACSLPVPAPLTRVAEVCHLILFTPTTVFVPLSVTAVRAVLLAIKPPSMIVSVAFVPTRIASVEALTMFAIMLSFIAPGSTDRRNTGVKSLRWGFKLQGLAWSFVELTRHFVQIDLRVHRQVGALGEVLSQQTIGVLI